ncbi:hypothetical protein D3C87_1322670 [compost metagenome]
MITRPLLTSERSSRCSPLNCERRLLGNRAENCVLLAGVRRTCACCASRRCNTLLWLTTKFNPAASFGRPAVWCTRRLAWVRSAIRIITRRMPQATRASRAAMVKCMALVKRLGSTSNSAHCLRHFARSSAVGAAAGSKPAWIRFMPHGQISDSAGCQRSGMACWRALLAACWCNCCCNSSIGICR